MEIVLIGRNIVGYHNQMGIHERESYHLHREYELLSRYIDADKRKAIKLKFTAAEDRFIVEFEGYIESLEPSLQAKVLAWKNL